MQHRPAPRADVAVVAVGVPATTNRSVSRAQWCRSALLQRQLPRRSVREFCCPRRGNGIVGSVTPEQFRERCPTIWHVAPAGAWDLIRVDGLRTAQQLIAAADLDRDTRQELLATPRRTAMTLTVGSGHVTLRDQEPLLRVKDLQSRLNDGLEVADWIRILNSRVYLFTDRAAQKKLLDRYVERDGAQDVLTISPLKLLTTAASRLELSGQNAGAIARKVGPYKGLDTFVSLARFPDKKPAEITVVDGLGVDELDVVVRAERHQRQGPPTRLN
jgi:hypothetical protein